MEETITYSQLASLLGNPVTREQTFSSMVEKYAEPLYMKILHIVLSHDDADDVLQDTLAKAWVNLNRFEGKAKFSTWLYRIAVNEAIDFLRRTKDMVNIDSPEAVCIAQQLMADEYFDGDEVLARLQQAVASLPEVQRGVFTMRYYDDLKYSEMSTRLGTSEGSLKASYHIAANKIRRMMEKK